VTNLQPEVFIETGGGVADDTLGRGDPGLERLTQLMPSIGEALSKLASSIPSASLETDPNAGFEVDEISLELGMLLGAEGSVYFIRGRTDATVGVAIKWKRKRSASPL
jgi:hypothetical protein